MRPLIIVLFTTLYCFALHPNGVTHFQTFTINSAQVAETNSHFLYQAKFVRIASACTSSVNVVLYNQADSSKIPKWVVYNADTIFLYADVTVSSTEDKTYTIGYGLKVNTVNTSSTFTNCGIVSAYGFDEASGTAVADYASGNNLTIAGSSTSGGTGLFCKALNAAASGAVTSAAKYTYNATSFSISAIISTTLNFSTLQVIYRHQTPDDKLLYISGNTIAMRIAAASTPQGSFSTSGMNVSEKYLLTVVYNGGGATNADKLKIYVNGTEKTLSFSTPIPVTVAGESYHIFSAAASGLVGTIDNALICSSNKSAGCISTMYNMLFAPTTFSTVTLAKATKLTGQSKSGRTGPNLRLW